MPTTLGTILYGSSGSPIYGRLGSPIYADRLWKISVSIEISWGSDDLDVCGHWDGSSNTVGWRHDGHTDENGYSAYWYSGDNTDGGPELIDIGYNQTALPGEEKYLVHLNWFRGSGSGTVTARDRQGNVMSATISPGTNASHPAETSDPYVTITLNADGTIKSVEGEQ